MSAVAQQILASETTGQREARLHQLRVTVQQRLASETAEQREVRLHQLSTMAQQRLASEIPEQREARLQQLTVTAQQRLASKTPEDREARLQQDRETHIQRRYPATSEFPLLQQPGVHSKMKTFHSKLASLTVSKCITCLERFPGLTVAIVSPDSTECVRCRRDKHITKVYSTANNMNPGPVPPELMVCEKNTNIMCEAFIMHATVCRNSYPYTTVFIVSGIVHTTPCIIYTTDSVTNCKNSCILEHMFQMIVYSFFLRV